METAIFSKETVDNDVVVITVNLSRATMSSAPQFRDYAMEVIGDGAKKIIANLSYCDFMDSSFLGALVAVLKKLKSIQGDMKVVITHSTPEGILSLTKMDKVFSVYKSLEEAKQSFND
jgi:anti-anti-sigma factor